MRAILRREPKTSTVRIYSRTGVWGAREIIAWRRPKRKERSRSHGQFGTAVPQIQAQMHQSVKPGVSKMKSPGVGSY